MDISTMTGGSAGSPALPSPPPAEGVMEPSSAAPAIGAAATAVGAATAVVGAPVAAAAATAAPTPAAASSTTDTFAVLLGGAMESIGRQKVLSTRENLCVTLCLGLARTALPVKAPNALLAILDFVAPEAPKAETPKPEKPKPLEDHFVLTKGFVLNTMNGKKIATQDYQCFTAQALEAYCVAQWKARLQSCTTTITSRFAREEDDDDDRMFMTPFEHKYIEDITPRYKRRLEVGPQDPFHAVHYHFHL